MSLRRVSSPWLMLPPSFENGGMSYNFYSLAENRVVSLKKKLNPRSDSPKDDALIVGSSHGWLALYNEHDRSLFLSNPVTGDHIRLPPIETLGFFFEQEKKYCPVQKLILSSPPHQQDCRAIIFLYAYRRFLAVCSPGRSSAWSTTFGWEDESHDDAVYSPTCRRFLCLLEIGSPSYHLTGWDVTDPSSPRDEDDNLRKWDMAFLYPDTDYTDDDCSKLDELYGNYPLRYIVYVEHTGQLWHVKRYFIKHNTSDSDGDHCFHLHKTVDFLVYVVGPCERDLGYGRIRNLQYKEDSLDGMALFVGINHSFALRAADYPELKPDCIYFTDTYVHGGHDIGIFDYKTKTISPCYYPCDISSIKEIYPTTPMWFTPSPH